MNRFFVKGSDIGDTARLSGEDAKHAVRVLRMQPGDTLVLCDGENTDYTARISGLTRDEVLLDILEAHPCAAEPERRITLFQGLPKAGKLELIIQKCVELGVYAVMPVLMERSVARLTPAEFEKRRERFQRVAYEAAKQCGRGRVPYVGRLGVPSELPLDEFDIVLMPYELEHEKALKRALKDAPAAENIAVIIGPEGGLGDAEAAELAGRGAEPVTLGRRILRTETAGMAALAMILYEYEG